MNIDIELILFPNILPTKPVLCHKYPHEKRLCENTIYDLPWHKCQGIDKLDKFGL